MKMLLTGKPVNAKEALSLGLVSELSDTPDLVNCAARALEKLTPEKTRDRVDKVGNPAAREAAYAQAQKQIAGVRPQLVAPAIILEAVRTGLETSFSEGLKVEQELFARCMDALSTRNKIYVFFATRNTDKVTDLGLARPRPVAPSPKPSPSRA